MRNIVLTGFMGAGKTTIGREVARRLNAHFIDMDDEIEQRAGKSIPAIFAEDGEATFRDMESALCEELSQQQGLVIATGGGALIDPSNRAVMTRSGTVVCLTCAPDEILQRVTPAAAPDRPLLNVRDMRAEIERLLAARVDAYAAIPWQIDTTSLSVSDIAERVIALADVITLPVDYPGGSYNIHIGDGLLDRVGEAMRLAGIPADSRVAVVSNPIVTPLYATRVSDALCSSGFTPIVCSVPDGEQHKTLATVSHLYGQFLVGGLDRSCTVVALGGGVTGDIAGFAAATFMRGIRFTQTPTTLLAMVDSSVGGKTGVDLPQGKNLVGAFKQPALVIIDPTTLSTLPPVEIRSGLAEVIKHGVIGDAGLFDALHRSGGQIAVWWGARAAEWIARALAVKIAIVQEDPFEHGRRAVLNLGHTAGHALEQLSGFSMRHGEAVGIGMVVAARIAVALGMADPELTNRITAILEQWHLPIRCPPYAVDAIWEAMSHDKKRRGRSLRWILPRAIGEVSVHDDVPSEVVRQVLIQIGAKQI
ncbi:MAG: 3-dehydroquinate synthase [Chloroflexi bacterium]|nr:3-dehydroquinate synthase [Chloroflexota bacterium]